jgi:hypothetical protein
MGRRTNAWQAIDNVLHRFSPTVSYARTACQAYLTAGVEEWKRPELLVAD